MVEQLARLRASEQQSTYKRVHVSLGSRVVQRHQYTPHKLSVPAMTGQKRPDFQSLPLGPSDPPFSAWGLYGPKDELGTLNLLTEEVVLAARSDIVTGKAISLK